MRKYALGLVLIILFFILILVMNFGLNIGPFHAYSYQQILKLSSENRKIYAELNEKNYNEFDEQKSNLDKAVNEYNSVKSKYNSLVSSGQIKETDIEDVVEKYNSDELCKKISDYAIKNNVIMNLDIVQNNDGTNLNIEVKGSYISITDFIYAIENDDSLGFEINEFKLEKDIDNLIAKFVIKNVLLSD